MQPSGIRVNRAGTQLVNITSTAKEQVVQIAGYTPTFVLVALQYSQQYLMVYHRQREAWEIVGGRMQSGEAPLEAAKREVFEETGQIVTGLNLKGALRLYKPTGRRTVDGLLYFTELTHLEQFTANSEIAAIRLWDTRADIGYVDEIDSFLLSLIQPGPAG